MLIGGLRSNGLSNIDVILIVFIGSLLIGLLCALLGLKGHRSNLGFTDTVINIFGESFAKVIISMRGVVCAGWFGINIITLVQAVLGFIEKYIRLKPFYDIVIIIFIFLIFSILNILLSRNLNVLKSFEKTSALLFFLMMLYIVFGITDMNADTANSYVVNQRPWLSLLNSVLLIFYYWSGLVSNITDYTRNAKNYKHCFWGNLIGIILGMMLVCILALLSSNKSEAILGTPVWNPIEIFVKFHDNVLTELITILVLFVFMTTTNIAANCYPAINCFSKLFSLGFYKSSLLLLIVSILLCPWFIISDFSNYAYYWINFYSLLIAPLIGMMVGVGFSTLIDGTCNKKNVCIYMICSVSGLILYFALPFLSNFMGMIVLITSFSLSVLLSSRNEFKKFG